MAAKTDLPLIGLIALAAAAYLAVQSTPPAHAADAQQTAREQRLQEWVRKASVGLAPEAATALLAIHGADRQLLALRSYIRAGDSLPQRWSWSQDRLSSYAATSEGKAAAADIDAVVAAFAAANPGYTLRTNLMPRSLEVQLAHWNQNPSVGTVASALVTWLEQRFPAAGTPPDANALREALAEWQPRVAANLAAPGLSAHGQGRAFDFEVEHQGRLIADADAASARQKWDATGWTRKLHQAVIAAGNRLVGPLQSPYEPWHYAYTPQPK
jgi:hypothetical protein